MMRISLLKLKRPTRPALFFWSLTAMVAALIVIRYSHSHYFIMDDWVVFGSRLDQKSLYGFDDYLLRRHNEHLIGGLVLWNFILASIFGLTSYTPWVITVVLVNLFVTWVLRQYMTRIGVHPILAAVASPLFLLIAPLGTLAYWGPTQIFILTLAMNLVHYSLTSHPGSAITKRDVFGAMISTLAVFIFSISVITIPVIAWMQVWHRRWTRALVALTPLLIYGLWTLSYGNRIPSDRYFGETTAGLKLIPQRDLALFLSFGWKLISCTIWTNSNPLMFIVVVCLVTAGIWHLRRESTGKRTIALAAIAVAALYVGGFTWSRGWFTDRLFRLDPPDRYVAVLALLLLPICLLGLQELVKILLPKQILSSRKSTYLFATAIIVLLTTVTLKQRFNEEDKLRPLAMASRSRIVAVANDPLLTSLPQSDYVFGSSWPTDLTFGDILRLKKMGWLK